MTKNDTNASARIVTGFDPASHEGDISVLTFLKGDKVLGNLTGEAAEYVHHALIQLEAELKWRRDNDTD